ncbi:MAG: hypothetical protein ACP5UV_02860 [Thermoplasmata archaeon]
MIHCGKVIFTSTDFKTDIMLYRDTSYLLLPAKGTSNSFRISSHDGRLHFHVCSEIEINYGLLSQFFTRNYPCYLKEDQNGIENGMKYRYYVNRSSDRKLGEIYFPRILRNIVNISYSFPELQMEYSAEIRGNTRGSGKYSMYVKFGMMEDSAYSSGIEDFIANEFLELKRRKMWKFARKKGKFALKTDLLSNTFNMINFVRIPEDINV